jgi:asparagine synthase (glutamine-hydrolysing)
MKNNSETLNLKTIPNILSIRYNPLENPPRKPAHWTDFTSKISDPDGHIVEGLLLQSIHNSIPNNDEPIIVSLSSGIDSSLVLALVRKVYPKRKIHALCGVFQGSYDESKQAKIIAENFDADFEIVNMDSIFSSLPELIAITKKPRWNTYHHLISKRAKNIGKFLLTGDGADEVFGGYVFRYKKFLQLININDNWKQKTIKYLECHNRDWVPDQEQIFGKKIQFNWNNIYKFFRPYFLNSLSPLEQLILADFNGKLLYDFIPTGKSIFDNYNINGIQIFLKPKTVEIGLQLPLNEKYNSKTNEGKRVLRKIAKRNKIEHISNKRGFSPGLLFDWDANGRRITSEYLSSDCYLIKNKIINDQWLHRAFDKIENDGDVRYLNRVISILALEIWSRIFITKELNSKSRL